MSRKPIHQEIVGGKTKRQRIWEAIRANGKEFDVLDVTPGNIAVSATRDYLRVLVLAEIVKITSQGTRQTRSRFALVKDMGIEAPRVNKQGEIVTQGQGNEAIWGAMQALGSFTARVLSAMSGVPENTVKHYCKMLWQAGYLTVDKAGKGTGRGGVQTQYRIIRSKINGPRPPMITRLKAVYDPNLHQIVWQQSADEVLEQSEAI